MKVVALIVLVCMVWVSRAAVLQETATELQVGQKVEFSEKARYLLKEASLRAVSFLCFGEKTDEQIHDTICKNMIAKMNRSGGVTAKEASNCMDCTVADPICWDACPQ